MRGNRVFFGILSMVALVGQRAAADPPHASHDYWQNNRFNGHYVLYDSKTRTYVETVDCKVLWRFTLVKNEMNLLTLFDASRGMTVQLTYEGMYLKEKNATAFTFYQSGSFDTRTQFQHFYNGQYTGALTKQDGCAWVEWFPGAPAPAFHFREISRNPTNVDLYDQSRNLFVRLTKDSMYLRTGSGPFTFFKSGHW